MESRGYCIPGHQDEDAGKDTSSSASGKKKRPSPMVYGAQDNQEHCGSRKKDKERANNVGGMGGTSEVNDDVHGDRPRQKKIPRLRNSTKYPEEEAEGPFATTSYPAKSLNSVEREQQHLHQPRLGHMNQAKHARPEMRNTASLHCASIDSSVATLTSQEQEQLKWILMQQQRQQQHHHQRSAFLEQESMMRLSQYPLGASAVPLLSESGRGRQHHSSLSSSALMMIGACVGSSEFTPMQQLHQLHQPEASSVEMMLRRELLERQIAVEQQRQLLEQYLLTLSSSSGILPSGLTLMQQTNTSQHLAPVSSLAGPGGSPGMMQTYLQLQQQRQMALIPNTGSTETLHSSDNVSRLQPKPTAADSLHYSAYPRKTIRQHRTVIPLSLPSDFDQLSSYQVLVRQQMEFFVANREDVTTSVQGRKQAVTLGQVGIRCRHCTNLPLRQRGRGSAYYPKKLQGVYQAVQNMSLTHLQLTCSCIPGRIREQLAVLHQRSEKTVGGKAYWVEACQTLGVMEDELNGLHFAEERDDTNHPDTK